MEHLLKTSALIAVFYAFYKLFLQRETFFEHNRWFLFFGLVTSFCIPFLVIPVYIETVPLNLNGFTFENQISIENIEKPYSILNFLPVIYSFGVVIFSIRFITQLISLLSLILKNKGEKNGKFTYVKTNKRVSPFSFFKWIVFNPNEFSQTELNQIIMHEKVHATQNHSLDILLTHLSCILLWFNPIMWFYNKDLKQNLEFIADKETANNSYCKKSYQYTLLKTSMPTHQMALSNPFYNSLIKKRIIMLHKSKSKKINLIKYALLIPVLALFLMSFNTKEIYVHKNSITEKLKKNEFIEVIITKDFKEADLEYLKSKLKSEGYTLKFKGIKRNTLNEITAIKVEVSSKTSHANYNIDSDNTMKPIKISINDGVISIGSGNFSKEKHMVFISEDDTTNAINSTGNEKNVFIFKSDDSDENSKEEIIIKNGDTIHLLNNHNGKKMKIESDDDVIFIAKDNNAKKIHKVITINNSEDDVTWKTEEDKKNVKSDDGKTKVIIRANSNKEPLIILDGKEIENEEMSNIDPNTIEKIDVLKGENATRLYSDKGKNGVVLITTKDKEWKTEFIIKKPFDSISNKKNTSKYTVKLSSEALYKIDGKEVKKEDVDKSNPDNIATINVLKGDIAIKKYGEKAKNGAVEITTKKK